MFDNAKGQRRSALLLTLCLALATALSVAPAQAAADARAGGSPGLAPGAGFDGRDHAAVVQLQLRLLRLGYGPGPIDGLYGPMTADAVRRLQVANKVAADGIAGRVTQRVLQAQSTAKPSLVRKAQRRLRARGYAPGHVDGLLGPRTVVALKKFRAQRAPMASLRVLARLDQAAPRTAAPRLNSPADPTPDRATTRAPAESTPAPGAGAVLSAPGWASRPIEPGGRAA